MSEEDGATPAVVRVVGDFDVYTAPGVRENLIEAIGSEDGPRHVIVDLNEADYLDPTAFGVLLGAHYRLLERDGGLLLLSAKEQHHKIYRLMDFGRPTPPRTKGVPLYATMDEALAAAEAAGRS